MYCFGEFDSIIFNVSLFHPSLSYTFTPLTIHRTVIPTYNTPRSIHNNFTRQTLPPNSKIFLPIITSTPYTKPILV